MKKYGVHHKVTTPYHPQATEQVEVSNIQIKKIMKKIIRLDGKEWSSQLYDALRAYRKTYKTPLGMSPYIFNFGKAYHLPIEIEHNPFWDIKCLNFSLDVDGKNRFLHMHTLQELRNKAYKNYLIYKIYDKKLQDEALLCYKFESKKFSGESKGLAL